MRISEEELNKILEKGSIKIRDRPSRSTTNLEQTAGDAALRKEETPRFDGPVSVVIDCYRHRLADPFGISEKYAIDSIVDRGVLRNDSTKEIVEEKSFLRQTKIKMDEEEKTIITITEITDDE